VLIEVAGFQQFQLSLVHYPSVLEEAFIIGGLSAHDDHRIRHSINAAPARF